MPPEQTRSGVFNVDVVPLRSAGYADDGRVRPDMLLSIWNEIAPNFTESRKRILESDAVTMGKRRAPVPRKYARNRDVFGPRLPQQITVPLHNRNVLGRKEPTSKRYTSGTGEAPLSRATRIEQWANPMMKKLVSWGEMVGILQDEAEMAAIVCPTEVRREIIPPPFEDVNSKPLQTYWRDKEGKDLAAYLGREKEFQRDRKRTAAAYEEALRDWEIEHPAIDVRLIHATDCVPVGLRITGDGPVVDGLILRSKWSRSKLRGEFRWLEPSGASSSQDVILYEGWLTDAVGVPYVVYSVNGFATDWADDGSEAFIDLHERYGMTKLLCYYEYGWHRNVRDLDARGLPFAWAFKDFWLSMQAIMGGAIANVWANGYGMRAIVPNKDAPKEAYMAGSEPRTFKFEPGGDLQVLPGQPVDLLPQNISSDVWRLLDFMERSVNGEGPPPGSFGGEGPGSGRERTVIRKHMEDAEAQIFEGGLRLHKKISQGVLELGCLLTERFRPIPVATTGIVARPKGGAGPSSQIVTLDPTDVGSNYTLEAEFAPKPGENLALAQQAAEFVDKKLRPRRWFHEDIMGDPDPEQTEAEIASDDMLYGEQGQSEIHDLAMAMLGDETAQQRLKLVEDQRISPLTGTPTSITGGLGGPPPGQPAPPPGAPGQAPTGPGSPHLTGIGLPSPGGASLGGQVAAAMETGPMMADAIQTGGVGVPGG
jgi:hypothetical protein